MPAPPSVDALPPMPIVTEVHPASSAAATASPTPRLLAVIGAGTPPGSRARPQTSAISTTASAPRRAYDVSTASPVGPLARRGTGSNPACVAASSSPSPPSETGTTTTSVSGRTERMPAARWSATSAAVRVPLNLSGPSRTRGTTAQSRLA